MLSNMLERPSNIFEHVQKHLTCYNMLYGRYITEYNNVIFKANRFNIDCPTCYITCYMTCLNGLLQALMLYFRTHCIVTISIVKLIKYYTVCIEKLVFRFFLSCNGSEINSNVANLISLEAILILFPKI